MTNGAPPITLASVPGQYVALACANLSPGAVAGERCTVIIRVPEPWDLGEIRITFDWFIPARRGSLSFWRPVDAERVDP